MNKHNKVSKHRQAKKESTTTVFLSRSSSDIRTVSCSQQPKSSCCCAESMSKKDSRKKYVKKDEETILDLLIFAIHFNDSELVARLCEKFRMNLNISNEDGISPLHFAAIVGSNECIEILREYGACSNLLDVRGQKPIYYATLMDNNDTVLSLKKSTTNWSECHLQTMEKAFEKIPHIYSSSIFSFFSFSFVFIYIIVKRFIVNILKLTSFRITDYNRSSYRVFE